MSAPREIPDRILDLQRKASDPEISAWVSANAGSGKTHVLTQRVIKLLLKGNDPQKILCITFTKAAAANMATRVFGTLAEWTTLDDDALDGQMRAIGVKPDSATRALARRLFAIAIETPGGLKVQTIHAFCTRLLHQFPFEANVAARFEVLDDASERQLLEALTLEAMLEGAAAPESRLGRAMERAMSSAADQTFREVIHEAIGKRDVIETWIARAGSPDAAIAELSNTLGVDPQDSEEAVCRECRTQGIAFPEWPSIAALFAGSGKKFDGYQAARWRSAAAAAWPDALDAYLSIFLREENGEPKQDQYLMSKELRAAEPALWQKLAGERDRLAQCGTRLRSLRIRDRTASLLAVAHAVVTRYRREKDRRGLLDYDDLIDRTLRLFADTSAAWVLYKLDLGIDHVLIDEAQDTSPKQWSIIRTLLGEFTAGAGARAVKRTMFAVGDDKQSIFSFQGADPRKFAEIAAELRKAFEDASLAWEAVKLRASFRSSSVILEAVDTVFSNPLAYAGFASDPVGTSHEALPGVDAGTVDIWPLVLPDRKTPIEGWDAPFDSASETSPRVQLARRIARHAAIWIADGLSPRDIIVLVRQRGPLFEAIIRALKEENIAVAGADRLVLTEHIAVMDLIALADALLLPQDDLALASALKSPLFGFDDDDLFEVAWDRKAISLRAALERKAAVSRRCAEAVRLLRTLADAAGTHPPFMFYSQLLGAERGRRKFLSRLGPEANDVLDEFLNAALAYEKREAPTLQGFIAWLRAAQSEIKRDMELARDEVRVMTVHGAKGLEAPVVILADTTSRAEGYHPPRLIPVPSAGLDTLVWAGSKESDPPVVAQARIAAIEAAKSEYRRLLYVALTRAKHRLVICGAASAIRKDDTPSIPEGCWYQLVETALRDQSSSVPAEDGNGTIHRHLKSKAPVAGSKKSVVSGGTALPEWLGRAVPDESRTGFPVTPSEALDDETRPAQPVSSALRAKSLERGKIVHRLLQSLPDVPADRRMDAARRHLERAPGGIGKAEREDILTQVFRILEDASFAPLFAQGSRAEVPVIGRLARTAGTYYSVSGQIDRLAVTAGTVLIADYKTNRPAPGRIEDVPASYLRQLALYRAVLRLAYPDRDVRAALVWTDNAELMPIPASILDRAYSEFASHTPA